MDSNCPECGLDLPETVILRACPECGAKINQDMPEVEPRATVNSRTMEGSVRTTATAPAGIPKDIRPDHDEHGQPINRAFNAARLSDRSLDELIGLAKMAVSDGIVTQDEAEFIFRWMNANAEVANRWPGNHLYRRLNAMLFDRHLDREEQRELLDLLVDLTGTDLETFSAKNCSTRLPLDQPQPQIRFNGSTFCFTGKFVYGTRRCCQDAVSALGGVPLSSIRKDLNYLVIGIVGSTDWIHSTHGRKIEKAIEYRSAGLPLAIISEEHWVNCLQGSL